MWTDHQVLKETGPFKIIYLVFYRYIAPTTQCLEKEQPVMMMSGKPVEGINNYRSWPKYRPGYDFPFDGCEQWNKKRRVVPEDEAYFDRTDYEQMNKEIEDSVLGFVAQLGGKPQN
jgi:hypothetical protein